MPPESLINIVRDKFLNAIRRVRPRDRWKVVIVDQFSLRLLSSVLRLYDVLNEDVILVESIKKNRQAYVDKEAIYFLVPTKESVSRFISDFTKKGPASNNGAMYSAGHIYFTGAIEDQVFITKPSLLPFYNLYSPHSGEHRYLDLATISDRLVSVCASLAIVPYIRYYRPIGSMRQRVLSSINPISRNFMPGAVPKRTIGFGEAGMLEPTIPSVAADLAWTFKKKLDEYFQAGGIPEDEMNQAQIPSIVIILDRSVDMIAPLIHEFTYQAMVTDLLDFDRENKYIIKPDIEDNQPEEIVVKLNNYDDVLWDELKHKHIADAIDYYKDVVESALADKHLKCQNTEGEMSYVEQDIATGYTIEGKKITDTTEEELIGFLANTQLEDTDRIRLLMMYLVVKDGIHPLERRCLQEVLRCMDDEDKRAVLNMNLLNVRTDKRESDPPRSNKVRFRWETKTKGETKFRTSRFVPAVKEIPRMMLEGKLPEELFPWVDPPLPEDAERWTSMATNSSTSLRRTRSLDSCKKENSDNAPRPKLIIFMTGGATYSEVRSIYELTKELPIDVYLGSTHITTPREFLQDLRLLRKSIAQPGDPDLYVAPSPMGTPPPQPKHYHGKGTLASRILPDAIRRVYSDKG
ncbi:syntaxin binding protein 1 [Mycoemilia scoparia]|uniref:Syntaxin binding protein 1 n=1 Tax=Mycoemilia scoparia TaxID=417184 RepID=A0A9W8DWH0_9FUNG|nr:syntaxin binding protein 1 [Mycoemilia scoparia]